jgi:hypothetical protein
MKNSILNHIILCNQLKVKRYSGGELHHYFQGGRLRKAKNQGDRKWQEAKWRYSGEDMLLLLLMHKLLGRFDLFY